VLPYVFAGSGGAARLANIGFYFRRIKKRWFSLVLDLFSGSGDILKNPLWVLFCLITRGDMGKFREIVIPGDVLDDENLSDGAKILYGKIARLSYKSGYCWASNSTLSGTKSENTASRNVKMLEKFGYVKCVYENKMQDRKIYICKIDSHIDDETPPKNDETTPPKMVNKQYKYNIQKEHLNKTEAEKKIFHIITLWQSNSRFLPFTNGFIKYKDVEAFFEHSDITLDMITTAINNYVDAVKNKYPFTYKSLENFIINGGIQRYQTPYKSRASPGAEMSPEELAEFRKTIKGAFK
jgi:hypothetical protein